MKAISSYTFVLVIVIYVQSKPLEKLLPIFLAQKISKDDEEALESSQGTHAATQGQGGVRGGGQRRHQRGKGCAVPGPRRRELLDEKLMTS